MAGHTAVTLRLLKTEANNWGYKWVTKHVTWHWGYCETEAPKNDMITVDLKTQDTKQNYKTKALKMSKGSMPQMSLAKRRENVVKSGKFKPQGCIKRSSSLN